MCIQKKNKARETDSGCKPSKGSSTGCKYHYFILIKYKKN